MSLSEHFSERELKVENAPFRVQTSARWLCENVLEPIRRHFNAPIEITSGYRPPEVNKESHGAKASYHMYEDDKCAVDLRIHGVDLVAAFDHIRLESRLPFDKIILERDHKTEKPTLIHIQAHAGKDPQPLHQAFLGETYNTAGYTQVECV